ncbi:hypothetical protein SAMN04515647_2598 [Cohaesibacter sp. ES.047]|uniref:hypothetical protein n=1 Tax=Cohaesibacter sp. ES.047 TaxID=1798205 RepID=UPI000BB7857E|nr:hypothetical protein [Cohaesibacter sp. ES.047]SNY92343.1 hypothetical protein SAMN04515647_2598 [Cohaesibacter sp. ES.047]
MFELSAANIEQGYKKSGNQLGWRFLSCPATNLTGAKVAFVGLNPAGNVPEDRDGFAMPEGKSAYRDESWGGKAPGQSVLQQQVLALFDRLKQRPEDVLSGQFIPFRSPRLNQLNNLQYSLKFGEELWAQVFATAKPKLVVTLGFDTLPYMQRILGVDQIEKVPVNWGNYCARRGRFSSGLLIAMPHLSTFKIMKRKKSTPALDALFDGVLDD